jgi:serine/threonine-protein kinase
MGKRLNLLLIVTLSKHHMRILGRVHLGFGFIIILLAESCIKPTNHFQLAQQNWNEKDYLGAIIELNTCISKEDQRDSIYLLRARCYQKIQKANLALDDYKRVMEINPDWAEARLEMSRIQLIQKDTVNAGSSFRILHSNSNKRIASDSWIETGRLHYFSDQFPSAINALNHAVKSDSLNYMAWYYRGLLFSRFFTPEGETGIANYPFLDFNAAISDYSRCIDLQADFADAWYQRAEVRFNMFDDSTGLRDINEAIRLEPKYSYYYAARAHQHVLKGRMQAALNDYNQSISLNQNDPDAFLGRSETYHKLGMHKEANRDSMAARSLVVR